MTVRDVLLLGNPQLYKICEEVKKPEIESLQPTIIDLHDTMMAFRHKWQAGRAIAAPQIGVMKRLIYLHIDTPVVLLNPYFEARSETMFEVWDDCMSFPELLVKVQRHQSGCIVYRDLNWQQQTMNLKGDLSELLQHEIDHLDGILAVSRAITATSFALRSQQEFTDYDRSSIKHI